MLHNVVLHGPLRRYGKAIMVEAQNAAEAVKVAAQLLRIKPHPISGKHMVRVVGYDSAESLVADLPLGKELHLVPAFVGGKNVLTSIVKIVIGAILIIASFYIPGLPQYAATFLFTTGASLVVGGLSNLLFPVQQADKPNNGAYTAASGNTTAIGTRIGLAFGRNVRIFGHILSYNVSQG